QVYTVRLTPEQRKQTRFALWANFFALLLNATLAVVFWKMETGKPIVSLMSVFSSCLAIVCVGLYRKSTQVLTLTDQGLTYQNFLGFGSIKLTWEEIKRARIERNYIYTWLRITRKKRFLRLTLVVPPDQADEILCEIEYRLQARNAESGKG
uniref:hypothetical protein n=1 Tax=Armatimonas sp. TaxID=1872638 RepID=UPI00286C9164